MTKTILVGDTHLKARLILPIVEKVISEQDCQRVIFLGDYVDWSGQENNIKLYAKDLTYLAEWKEKMLDRGIEVINLIGNHDIFYVINFQAPFSLKNKEAFLAVQDTLLALDLQIAYKLGSYLVSHAGYNLLFDLEDWHLAPFDIENNMHFDELVRFANSVGIKRGGGEMGGSPVWADFREIEMIPNEKVTFKQIVGHTPQTHINVNQSVIGIDTFAVDKDFNIYGNGDLLIHDDQTNEITVIQSEWKTLETCEALKNLI